MQERIREILSWYGSDNPGTLTNLARLLNHGALGGTGKLVILPVDQGVEPRPRAAALPPNPPAYDPRYHFELAIDAGLSAYAAPLGFLEAGARDYAGDLPLILKLNNRENLHSDADPTQALTGSIADCLALGLRWHWLHGLSGFGPCGRRCTKSCKPWPKRPSGTVWSWWSGSYPRGHGLEQGRRDCTRRHCVRRSNRRPARGPHHQGQTAYGLH